MLGRPVELQMSGGIFETHVWAVRGRLGLAVVERGWKVGIGNAVGIVILLFVVYTAAVSV